MLIVIDIDKTLVDNDSILYCLLNRNTSFLRDKCVYGRELDTFEKLKPTILNKTCPIFDNDKFYFKQNAVDTVNELYEKNEIILLSSRPYSYKTIRYLTIEMLKTSGLKVDAVFLNCKHKWNFCERYKVDLFVDNNPNQCKEVSTKTKTKSICVGDGYNSDIDQDIIFLEDWQAIGDYASLILPIINAKNKPYLDQDKLKANFRENRKLRIQDKIFDADIINSPYMYNEYLKCLDKEI